MVTIRPSDADLIGRGKRSTVGSPVPFQLNQCVVVAFDALWSGPCRQNCLAQAGFR